MIPPDYEYLAKTGNKIDVVCSLKHLSKQDIESQGHPHQGGREVLLPMYSIKKRSHVSHSPIKTIPFSPT